MKIVIVVPTVREECIVRFLREWESEFKDSKVIVIEDSASKSFTLRQGNVEHYSWHEIDSELGEVAWIIPRKTGAIRSFGIYKAWLLNPEAIICLDDDCLPGDDLIEKHCANLFMPQRVNAWVSTGEGTPPRGMPYFKTFREVTCMVSHGLWSGSPDFDGITQLLSSRNRFRFELCEQVIPRGLFFPMCAMNIAFRREVAPLLYQLLMGQGYPYHRFDDIWAGIIMKKICDHLGFWVKSGGPVVVHDRASNVWTNIEKEMAGLRVNEEFWVEVDRVVLESDSVLACYGEMAEKVRLGGEYWDRLREAMKLWASLFSEEANRYTCDLVRP